MDETDLSLNDYIKHNYITPEVTNLQKCMFLAERKLLEGIRLFIIILEFRNEEDINNPFLKKILLLLLGSFHRCHFNVAAVFKLSYQPRLGLSQTMLITLWINTLFVWIVTYLTYFSLSLLTLVAMSVICFLCISCCLVSFGYTQWLSQSSFRVCGPLAALQSKSFSAVGNYKQNTLVLQFGCQVYIVISNKQKMFIICFS